MRTPTTPQAKAALASSVQAAIVGHFDSWSRVERAGVALVAALVEQGLLSDAEALDAFVEPSEEPGLVALFVADDAFLLRDDGTVEAF